MENIQIRQQFIIDAVRKFRREHPQEYNEVCQSVKKLKPTKGKFGEIDNNRDESIRWTLRIPKTLFKVLDYSLDNPRFLEADLEINWFKRAFPMFKVADKA